MFRVRGGQTVFVRIIIVFSSNVLRRDLDRRLHPVIRQLRVFFFIKNSAFVRCVVISFHTTVASRRRQRYNDDTKSKRRASRSRIPFGISFCARNCIRIYIHRQSRKNEKKKKSRRARFSGALSIARRREKRTRGTNKNRRRTVYDDNVRKSSETAVRFRTRYRTNAIDETGFIKK